MHGVLDNMSKNTYLFFHSDHPLHLVGQNSGAENATLSLSSALSAQGHRVIVCANLIDSKECIKKEVEFWNFGENYDIASIFKRAKDLDDYILISACRALPIIQSQSEKNCLKRFLICHDPSSGAFGIKPEILTRICDGVICVSNAQKELIVQGGADPNKIQVIYNGANLKKFFIGDIEKRNFKRMVFVGALVAHKGIDILLSSTMDLLRKYPDLILDVYGSASLWGQKQTLFDEKEISRQYPNIKFHGAVSQDEVAKAFREAGVCIIPSRWFDCFPLTAVEAQVSGCPIVAFDVGGIRECVEDNKSGILINNISQAALTNTLDMLFDFPQKLKDFSKYASENFYKKFNWEKTAIEVNDYCVSGIEDFNPKIGFLTTWNQPCGLASYAKMLLEEFKNSDITILAEDSQNADLKEDGKNVIRCWKKQSKDFSYLANVIKENQIDILYLYCHYSFFINSNFVSLMSELKKDGLKIILHLHNTFSLDKNLEDEVALSDRIIVHSEENKLQIIANGATSSKIRVVPLSLKEIEKISYYQKEAIRKELGVLDNEKLLLSFGFIQPHKGMEVILEAVIESLNKGIAVKGVIVGSVLKEDPNSEKYYNDLLTLIKNYNLESHIKICNEFISDQKLNEYIQSADLVFLNYKSSYYESSGAGNLALMNGATLITSLAPMFEDYKNCAWHLTSGFPAGLSTEILLKNKEIKSYLSENTRKFLSTHSFKIASKLIANIFKELALKPNEINRKQFNGKITCKESQMQNKKILIVNRSNAVTQRGGDTIVMENLYNGLREKGFMVDIDLDHEKNFKDYDLIHIFNFATPQFSTNIAMEAKSKGVPFVVTSLFEDVSSFHNQSWAVANFMEQYQSYGQDKDFYEKNKIDFSKINPSETFNVKWICDNATALFTSGISESKNIKRIYDAKAPMYEIPFGLNTPESGDANRFVEKYKMKDFILCVGRFESRKNQLMLLKALEDVAMPVVLIGGGFSYQPNYEMAIRGFKRKGQTRILGRLSNQDLADAYSACRIHCLPSFYELPGLVSLEAAYYGANVVASDTGTTKDYLKDYAFYCDPYSPDSIKNAVLAAFYSPKKYGLKEYAMSFTWNQYVDKTIKAYQEILEKNINISVTDNSTKDYDKSINDSMFEEKFQEAEALAQKSEFSGALDIYYEIEKQSPSPKVYRSIGAVELARNNFDIAKKYFEKALAIDNQDVKSLSGFGICTMRQGDVDGAMKIFMMSLEKDPYQIVTILQLMECAYVSNQFLELKDALETYLIKYPDNVDMQFSYAGALYKLGCYEKADNALKIVREKMPFYTGLNEMQSKIDEQKDMESSRKNTKTEILMDSEKIDDTFPNSSIDSVDIKLADLEEAKKKKQYDVFNRGIDELMKNSSLNDEHREYVNILKAESLMISGDNNSAVEILSQVMTKNPMSYRAMCDIGIVEATSSNWQGAKEKFESSLSINPKYDVAFSGLGLYYTQEKNYEKAFECYMNAVKINPENVRGVLGIIELSYKLDRLDDLESTLKNYLEFHPADLNFLYSLAACYYKKFDYEKALDVLSRVFLFNPDYQNAIELKQLIEEKVACQSNAQM